MLTQAFAATLAAADGLARHLASDWFDGDPHALENLNRLPVGAQLIPVPQYRLKSGDRIDLVLRPPPGTRGLETWIEVKHHAHLSGDDQLLKYAAQLASLASSRVDGRELLFLTPAGYQLVDLAHRPDRLFHSNWQQVGEVVDTWVDANRPDDAKAAWIAAQFARYLEEEGLYMSSPLETQDLASLARAESAGALLAVILERMRADIDPWMARRQISFPGAEQKSKRPRWPEYWRHYGTDLSLFDAGAAFEWNLRAPDFASDRLAVGAGLTFFTDPDESAWDVLADEELGRDFDHTWNRAFRFKFMDELLELWPQQGVTSLDDQVHSLATFVKDAFEAGLRAIPKIDSSSP